jgi:hypothetical protein
MIPPSGKATTYLFSYHYQGDRYSLEVPAYNKEDAIGRVRQMAEAVYDGELVVQIPAGGSIVTRFLEWLHRPSERRIAARDR